MKTMSAMQTSGSFLISVLAEEAADHPDKKKRYALAFDVYIKHRSFAILNKVLFFTSMLSGAAVALWPILIQFPPLAQQIETLGAAVVQTAITGFAGFNLYAYHHYKVRQVATENLLRMIVFTSKPLEQLTTLVRDEMFRLDQGIGIRTKADDGDDDKKG
jgi:hypothetical protein